MRRASSSGRAVTVSWRGWAGGRSRRRRRRSAGRQPAADDLVAVVTWPPPPPPPPNFVCKRSKTGPFTQHTHQPLNSGERRSRNVAMPSPMSDVVPTRSWNSASSSKLCSRLDSKPPVGQPLGQADGLRRQAQDLVASSIDAGVERGGRHEPVDQADALGLGGRAVLAEEHQFLGPVQPDETRQQIAAAGVRHDVRRTNTSTNFCRAGDDDEVARESESRCCCPLAVPFTVAMTGFSIEDRADETAASRCGSCAGDVAHGPVRSAFGSRRSRSLRTPSAAPVQKCRSPVPRSTTTRTRRSSQHSKKRSASRSRMVLVSEFPRSGGAHRLGERYPRSTS